jgi:hypothetical protein
MAAGAMQAAGCTRPTKGCSPPQVLYCNGTQVVIEGLGSNANNISRSTYTVGSFAYGFEDYGSIFNPARG